MNRLREVSRIVTLAGAVSAVAIAPAAADSIVCDLRTTGSCTINGAIFSTYELQPTGTGVIDSFVRIQDNGTEQGYNTSARPVEFDEKTDPNFTRDLLLSAVGTTTIEGVDYATFYLDINETAARTKEWLTLDQLEVFTSDQSAVTGYTGVANTPSGSLAGTTKIYDLDLGGDNYIQLSYNLNDGGSGQSDLVFYLPMSLFTGEYVNLFSQFGNIDGSETKYASDAGFEEWFTKAGDTRDVTAVPEPGTIALFGVGLLGLARRLRRA